MDSPDANKPTEPALLHLLGELEKEYGVTYDKDSYDKTHQVKLRHKGLTVLEFSLENWKKRDIAEGEIRNVVDTFVGTD